MSKKYLHISGLVVVALLAISMPAFAHRPGWDGSRLDGDYGDHKRNTTYICEKNVEVVRSGSLADGRRYKVVELRLLGNDNASIHYDERGSLLPLNNKKCTNTNENIWDNDWKFQPSKVTFDGDKPIDISLGGVKSTGSTYDFCGITASSSPATRIVRSMYGIDCKINGSEIATINDLGAASINGKKLYCVGLPKSGYESNFSGYPTCPNNGPQTDTQIYNVIKAGETKDYEGMPTVGYLTRRTIDGGFELSEGYYNVPTVNAINPSAYRYVSENSQPSLIDGTNYFNLNKNGTLVGDVSVKLWAANTENPWGGITGTRDGVVPKRRADFSPPRKANENIAKIACGGNYVQCKSVKSTVMFTLIYNKKTQHDASFTGYSGPLPAGSLNPYQNSNKVLPGKKYSVQIKAWNNGPDNGKLTELFVENKNTSLASHEEMSPIDPAAYKGGVNTILGGDKVYIKNKEFCSEASDKPLSCWFWSVYGLPKNKKTLKTNFTFLVSASAKQNDKICFDVYIREKDAGSSKRKKVCFKVDIPTKPVLKVEGGDARSAGARMSTTAGTACVAEPSYSGDVKTHSSPSGGASYGQYAVMGKGAITGFRSENDSLSTNKNLTFYNNKSTKGGYEVVCREDLAKKIENEPLKVTRNNMTGLLSGPAINDSGMYIVKKIGTTKFTTTGITIPKGSRKTVVINGDLVINGNIKYPTGGYSSRKQVSALAVIVKGNIHIGKDVDTIEGLFVASGKIITCSNGTSSALGSLKPNIKNSIGRGQCAKPLKIKGAIVANEIYFRRTYGDIGTGKYAETISFLPELYIAPPPFSSNLLELKRNDQLDLPAVF